MLSSIKRKTPRFFTHLWVILFLFSQVSILAGRSATEIAVTEWNPLSGPIVTPLTSASSVPTSSRPIDIESLQKGVTNLTLDDVVGSTSSSTATSSSSSISVPSSSSASPERLPSAERTIIPGFRSFLDCLKFVEKLSERDFVLVDDVAKVFVFHRVFMDDGIEFQNIQDPNKPNKYIQEFSRSWLVDHIKRQDLLGQVIMERYGDEEEYEEDEPFGRHHYSCIRTASALIPQEDGSHQVKFYGVFDQLKPGPQEYKKSPKLRPDGFLLKDDWDQETSALVYLDYLAVRDARSVINFSNKGLFIIHMDGCIRRVKRIFQFDKSSHYLDFSNNSLDDLCVQSLGSSFKPNVFTGHIVGMNFQNNNIDVEGIEPLVPLIIQDGFEWLQVSFNRVGLEDFDTLRSYIKTKFRKQLSEKAIRDEEDEDSIIERWLSKIIFTPNTSYLPEPFKSRHEEYYSIHQ